MTQQLPPWLAACLVIAILAAVNVIDIKVPHAALVAGPCAPPGCRRSGCLPDSAGRTWDLAGVPGGPA